MYTYFTDVSKLQAHNLLSSKITSRVEHLMPTFSILAFFFAQIL